MKYQFKFPLSVKLLFYLMLLFTTTITIYSISHFIKRTTTSGDIVRIVIALLVTIFVISLLIVSHYKITKNFLFLRFGFIVTKIATDDIKAVVFYKKLNKLVVYYKDKYSIIVISNELITTFRDELLKTKNHIVYQEEDKN